MYGVSADDINRNRNIARGGVVHQAGTSDTGFHSYSSEEVRAFAEYINRSLADDPQLVGLLPLDPNNHDQFFLALQDGVLICKLLNTQSVQPHINPQHIAINPRSVHHKYENLNMAVKACKDLKIPIVNIQAEDWINQRRHLMLSMLWQVIRHGLLEQIKLHPEIISLVSDTEELQTFLNLAPEEQLRRWFNAHLRMAGSPKQVSNFGTDIADGDAYLTVMSQVAPNVVPKYQLDEIDAQTKANMVCNFADQMGLDKFVTPDDILNGNKNLNLAFVADMFNKYPGLNANAMDEAHQNMMKEVQLQAQLQMQEEELLRQERWRAEEEERRRKWAEEDANRQALWQAEDQMRQLQLAEQEARLLGEDLLRQQLAAEQEARLKEDSLRLQQMADEQEARRREDEMRQREMLQRQQMEDEMRRRDNEQQRMALEDQQRALEQQQQLLQQQIQQTQQRQQQQQPPQQAQPFSYPSPPVMTQAAPQYTNPTVTTIPVATNAASSFNRGPLATNFSPVPASSPVPSPRPGGYSGGPVPGSPVPNMSGGMSGGMVKLPVGREN